MVSNNLILFTKEKPEAESRATRPSAVILSAAKDLRPATREILRCAQDDSRV